MVGRDRFAQTYASYNITAAELTTSTNLDSAFPSGIWLVGPQPAEFIINRSNPKALCVPPLVYEALQSAVVSQQSAS
jgi:hypothetical protein